jgi:hypothetical protein
MPKHFFGHGTTHVDPAIFQVEKDGAEFCVVLDVIDRLEFLRGAARQNYVQTFFGRGAGIMA